MSERTARARSISIISSSTSTDRKSSVIVMPSSATSPSLDNDNDNEYPASKSASDSGSHSDSLSESRSQRLYACLFHTLSCHESFDDEFSWRQHILNHFGPHPTPCTARCPMCATVFNSPEPSPTPTPSSESESESEPSPAHTQTQTQTNPSAWNAMLDHVANDHYSIGQTVVGSRPDFELMRYLYGMRIITDAQFKAMQLPPAPSSPAYHRSQDGVRKSIGSADEPFFAPYSKRREERLRSQRGVGVV